VFVKFHSTKQRSGQRLKNCGRSFLKDKSGATAVEFALVGVPFLTLMFGIINTGMYFYAVNCIDRGIEDTARYLRTGEAQKGTVASLTTIGQFRDMVCLKSTNYINCNNLQIRVESAPTWNGINAITCPTAGNLAAGAIASNDATSISAVGTQGTVVLIVACYKWDLGRYLPFVHWDAQFTDGSALIQSSTALKIEPYI
jgi:Flp pilus assembly protein TadG